MGKQLKSEVAQVSLSDPLVTFMKLAKFANISSAERVGFLSAGYK